MRRRSGTCPRLALVVLAAAVAAHAEAAPPTHTVSPSGARVWAPAIIDNQGRIAINAAAMVVTNTGSFAWDRESVGQQAGYEFPRGSGKTALFACGLWLAAKVNGGLRVAVSEYEDEYRPGAVLGQGPGAVPDDPALPEYRVYSLHRVYADTAARDSALAAYQSGAVPHGAPAVSVHPDGSLAILGDQMLWSVFNDLDPAGHSSRPGSTPPLGVEVQQTTWAYADPVAWTHTIFTQYKIVNKSASTLDSMYFALWSDPDIGGFTDDLVGCDVARSLGFAYNATNADDQYGTQPPSVGIGLIRGPRAGDSHLPMTSFQMYFNGIDPSSSLHTWFAVQGYDRSGGTIVDPTSGQPTRYMLSGDPVAGTGWLDANPADRRMIVSSGPFTMPPGERQEPMIAIVAGQGADRLESISFMKFFYDQVRQGRTDVDGGRAFPDGPLTLHPIAPNPSTSAVRVGYTLAAAGPVRLAVHDAQGRRVALLDEGWRAAGPHDVVWSSPGAVPAGIYFVRAESQGRSWTRRIVRIR